DDLLDSTGEKPAVPAAADPAAGAATVPAAKAPRQRRPERRRVEATEPTEPEPVPGPTDPGGTATAVAGRTTVELVIVPDAPASADAVAAVEALELLPPVRDALRAAVLSLPSRNPRQTKAFVNLWRFYMVLDHRMGLFSPSLLAI